MNKIEAHAERIRLRDLLDVPGSWRRHDANVCFPPKAAVAVTIQNRHLTTLDGRRQRRQVYDLSYSS